jgi:hypothetical protein
VQLFSAMQGVGYGGSYDSMPALPQDITDHLLRVSEQSISALHVRAAAAPRESSCRFRDSSFPP